MDPIKLPKPPKGYVTRDAAPETPSRRIVPTDIFTRSAFGEYPRTVRYDCHTAFGFPEATRASAVSVEQNPKFKKAGKSVIAANREVYTVGVAEARKSVSLEATVGTPGWQICRKGKECNSSSQETSVRNITLYVLLGPGKTPNTILQAARAAFETKGAGARNRP